MKRSVRKSNSWGLIFLQKKVRNLKFYKEEFENPGSRNGNYIGYMYFAPRFRFNCDRLSLTESVFITCQVFRKFPLFKLILKSIILY